MSLSGLFPISGIRIRWILEDSGGHPSIFFRTKPALSIFDDCLLGNTSKKQLVFRDIFKGTVTALSYDDAQDRFYLLGSGGAQLALPGCSHCNSISRYPTETLFARIAGSTKNLLLGSDGFQRVEEQ